MRRILRLLLLTCGGLLALVPSAAAELNQDWQSDDGSGLKCWECIFEKCEAAHEGHKGKYKCTTTCDAAGCSCTPSGGSCTGGSARIWIVPNGEGLTPALQQPPTGSLEALLRGCA